ncbi:GAD-like domain-containing protein [Acidiphilium sp. PA]|uniref:GAD-like domain-containing protein n=1 Tax=Acidiphilium sp. PA TaxID=2871705 RepID=UPI0022444BA6|nr:GAD-like domain-containing protein [Acidiphilium sp. PA]MCW8308658.1 GAD-like domain-containing protein [Acidiphilium sp. PA]
MTELNEDFAYCLEKFGLPVGGERIDPRVLEAYRSIVPDSMIAFWKECGVGLWLDGRFQLVSPDRYRGLLDLILQGDPDYPPDQSVLIGYGAFGKLLIWNNQKYALKVDLVEGIAYTTFPKPRFNILPPDVGLPGEISRADSPIYDCLERTDAPKPLFIRAVKTYGKLAHGECYGFVPAVGLGGRGVLEDVQRVRALEHFSILAQLGPIELRYMDTETRKIVVLRALGG